MYEINNMKLRYTLIGVLCFSINIVLQAQQQALEGKIAGFLKGKKATVGVAVLTDKDETILHNNEVHYPLLSVFKFHVALAVLDKMNREEIPLKHIVHVKASQLQPKYLQSAAAKAFRSRSGYIIRRAFTIQHLAKR